MPPVTRLQPINASPYGGKYSNKRYSGFCVTNEKKYFEKIPLFTSFLVQQVGNVRVPLKLQWMAFFCPVLFDHKTCCMGLKRMTFTCCLRVEVFFCCENKVLFMHFFKNRIRDYFARFLMMIIRLRDITARYYLLWQIMIIAVVFNRLKSYY